MVLGRSVTQFLQWKQAEKLNRYETTLQRQLLILLNELRDMQARRKDGTRIEAAPSAPE